MNCCTVLIKIKDFMPKLSKIPFNNYICVFTNNDFEGRISLMQYEYQHINHEIKDIKSDIIYKIKLIDLISQKIIGISEHYIKYNIINKLDLGTSINFINQITILPYIKNTQKISSKLNYYNKINLTISTEIIKFNKTPINYISTENSDFLKLNLKFDPNKTKTLENKEKYKNINNTNIKRINTNFNVNEKGKRDISLNKYNEDDKNNINLNMHNITVKNYYTINSATPLNIKAFKNNKIYTKKYFKKLNKNKITENNYSAIKSGEKQEKIYYNNKIYQSSTNKIHGKNKLNKNDYFSSIESLDTNRSINLSKKKMILTKLKYNNNSFKVINASRSNSSSIDKSNNKVNYFRLYSSKKHKSKNKLIFVNKSLEISSYNLTYKSTSILKKQKYNNNKLESIISPKNNKVKTNCNNLKQIHIVNLKSKHSNDYQHKNNKYVKEYKKNIISLLEFYILLSKKMKKLKDLYNAKKSKYLLGKENLMNIKEKKNIIEEKKDENIIKKYLYVNIHSKLNNQIISKFRNIKKKEINIFKNIFNIKVNHQDISIQLSKDNMKKEEQSNKINLYVHLLKNIIGYYGNITQIYNDNYEKKYQLLHLLMNKGIEINRTEFLYNKNKKKKIFGEIKEELNEENEEESNIDNIDEDKEPNEQSVRNDYLADKNKKDKNFNLMLNLQKNKNNVIICLEKYSRNNRITNNKELKKDNNNKEMK